MTKTGNMDLIHIGNTLEKVLAGCRPRKDMGMTRVWEIWDQALGADISANTRPGSFKGGTLVVLVSSSAWLHQLRFLEQEMIGQLNTHLEQTMISRIQYKIGPIHS